VLEKLKFFCHRQDERKKEIGSPFSLLLSCL